MSMFGAKAEPKLVEDGIADLVRAAKAKGDRAIATIPPKPTFPPTASNVFASNAIELLNKREEILNKAISLADELDMLAKEQIATGLRLQDFMKEAQEITSAVVETKKVLAQCPPSTKPQPSLTSADGTSTTSPNDSNPKDGMKTDGSAAFEPPPEATGVISPEDWVPPPARQS